MTTPAMDDTPTRLLSYENNGGDNYCERINAYKDAVQEHGLHVVDLHFMTTLDGVRCTMVCESLADHTAALMMLGDYDLIQVDPPMHYIKTALREAGLL